MTLFHLFSFLFLKSAALSKSPPDFQLLLLAAAPDKQNLLDQADFTAAPAHMAASVAHSLSRRALFPLFTITFMFGKICFPTNSYTVLTHACWKSLQWSRILQIRFNQPLQSPIRTVRDDRSRLFASFRTFLSAGMV